MAGRHHWLDGRESQWTLGVGDGQEGLSCCDSRDRKVLDTTERLIWSDHFSSVTQSCPTFCDPKDNSMPGFPVHHQLPELAQTHVPQISDTIQSSHSLSSPSPPAFNFSPNQGLSQWVSSPHQVAKVLEFQLQHQSFQWIFRTDLLEDWLVWSPCSLRDSQESSPTPQFKSINS